MSHREQFREKELGKYLFGGAGWCILQRVKWSGWLWMCPMRKVCGVVGLGWTRDLGVHLRQWPVSSRPSGPREAGGPSFGLSGGGGCDRRALVLPSGSGGGAHVPIPSA
jgi:hypothetical protein